MSRLEESFSRNHKGPEHDSLCQLPGFVFEDNSYHLWNEGVDLPSAISDAAEYAGNYKKKVQFVMARCNHHVHPLDPKTKERVPLAACKSKKVKDKCKHKFPQTRKLTEHAKVICRGNARKYGLRPSGRRNALATILSRRRCPWLSGCSPGMAIFFWCNTHTAPNYRVPPNAVTHDPDCTADCLKTEESKVLTSVANRASRNTTGYFTGYMTKRQPVGTHELKQATDNLKLLEPKLATKSNAAQYHNMANRLLGDLEFRGHVRPITEEFNLAANYHKDDVMNAEFYRTFDTQTFLGQRLLELERREIVNVSLRLPKAKPGKKKPGDRFYVSGMEAYGYRGTHSSIYYLCPWEFTMFWRVERLLYPEGYERKADIKTQWTEAGLKYKEEKAKNPNAPPYAAGEHYIVIDSDDPTKYLSFPDNEHTTLLRHNAIMTRWKRPKVPQPSATPLPTATKTETHRARIFSVYLRPWVLVRDDATPHVPHLGDLDLSISDVLAGPAPDFIALPLRRIRGKQLAKEYKDARRHNVGELKRCYSSAWKDYCSGHVVSKHAAKVILQWKAGHLSESMELCQPDDDEPSKKVDDPVDTSWSARKKGLSSVEKIKCGGRGCDIR